MLKKSIAAGILFGIAASNANALPFTYLHPDFEQELVVSTILGGSNVAGVTLGLDGYLYTNGASSNPIAKWDPNNRTTVNGSSLYNLVGTNTGAPAGAYGITIDNAGTVYSLGSTSLYSLNSTTLAGTYVGAAGYYGLAYSNATDSFISSGGSYIMETRKDGSTRSFSTGGVFIDQVAIDPTGNFIAGAVCCSSSTGSVRIWDFNTGALAYNFDIDPNHAPDGLAFDLDGNIYTNNTDGTITRLEFGNGGFAGGITGQTLIASGGFYGDLAGVGADGAFYVSQYGTRFDNGTTSGHASIVKISLKSGGFVDGGTGGSQNPTTEVPEPQTLLLMSVGLLGMLGARRKTIG